MSQSSDRGTKRALDQVTLELWESGDFKDLGAGVSDLELHQDVLPAALSLVELSNRLAARFREVYQTFPDPKPSELYRRALMLIALNLDSGVNWDARSDILASRLLGSVFGEVLRAHADGVYTYENGAWKKIEEIPEPMLRTMERVLTAAQNLYKHLMTEDVERSWIPVFESLKNYPFDAEPKPVCDFEFHARHWAAVAGKELRMEKSNFTSTARGKALVEGFGAWFRIPKEVGAALVNFQDATLRLRASAGSELQQVHKSPENNCYVHIPIELSVKPSDDSVARVRLFLATTFAGNPDGRMLDACMEALSLYSTPMPQKIIIMRGPGGDGKSARSTLRHNVFAGGHQYMSTSVFEVDEEFRRQGGQFAHARCITFQECSSNFRLKEDLFKTFVGGEDIACRPNYGITTHYYSWSMCGKYWEMNLVGPTIEGAGDDLASLRSWTRRILVINMESSYTANPDKVDPECRVFQEDPDLRKFLGSPEARLAYTVSFLLPFLQKHTAEDCVRKLINPPEHIVFATNEFVKSMARQRGVPAEPLRDEDTAKRVLWEIHGGKAVPQKFLRTGGIARCSAIKLGAGEARNVRVEKFTQFTIEYPFLFRFVDEQVGFRRLNANLLKYEEMRSKAPTLGLPGLEAMPVVFDLEDKYSSHVSGAEDIEPNHVFEAPDADCDSYTEAVDLAALKVWQRGGKDRGAATLGRYIRHCETNGVPSPTIPGRHEVVVQYVRKFGVPGRRYAKQCPTQHLTREARSVAFGPECLDLDFKNSHPTCLHLYLKKKGVAGEFPILASFVHNPDGFRAFVSQYYSETLELAKKRIVVLVFGCPPRDHFPLLWALFDEIQRAAVFMLHDIEFSYLVDMFGDRPNPPATRLSYALSALEDQFLQHLLDMLTNEHPTSQVMVLMFDGVILRVAPENRPGLLDSLARFQAHWGIVVVASEMNVVGGAAPGESGMQRCLMDAVDFLGADETLLGPGPFALAEGVRLLEKVGLGLARATVTDLESDGKYLVYSKFHFVAAWVEKGKARVMDDGEVRVEDALAFADNARNGLALVFRLTTAQATQESLPDVVGGGKPRQFRSRLTLCDCGGKLFFHKEIDAVLYDMTGCEQVKHISLRCSRKSCRCCYSYNFKWKGGKKHNTERLTNIQVIFVNDKMAFSKTYLAYHEALHFRGFLSARAVEDAGGQVLFAAERLHSSKWFRTAYQDARFLYLAMRELQEDEKAPVPFVIGKEVTEAMMQKFDTKLHLYDFAMPDTTSVKEVVIDGHQKVMARVCGPVARSGRPRKDGTVKPFTHGWFMAVHPQTGRILGVQQMLKPENNTVAIQTLRRVVRHYPALDCVVYDRACRLLPQIQREGLFDQVKYWTVDKFHACRHRKNCTCNPKVVKRLQRRVAHVNTSVAEQTFGWFRGYARSTNELRAVRHKFLVLSYAKEHNRRCSSDHIAPDSVPRAKRARASTPYECNGQHGQ